MILNCHKILCQLAVYYAVPGEWGGSGEKFGTEGKCVGWVEPDHKSFLSHYFCFWSRQKARQTADRGIKYWYDSMNDVLQDHEFSNKEF